MFAIPLAPYNTVAMTTEVKGYMLLRVTLQTAERERNRQQEGKKGRIKNRNRRTH